MYKQKIKNEIQIAESYKRSLLKKDLPPIEGVVDFNIIFLSG